MTKLEPRDAEGKRIRLGDIVRVLGTPDASTWSKSQIRFSLGVFRHLVGKRKRVVEFDEIGFAKLAFKIEKGRHAGTHDVWIEPNLLKRLDRR